MHNDPIRHYWKVMKHADDQLFPSPDTAFLADVRLSMRKAMGYRDRAGNFLRVQCGPGKGDRILEKEAQLEAVSVEEPPCYGKDANSDKKVYFSSAEVNGSLVPCKASESETPMACAAWAWKEHVRESFTILRFDRDLLELVTVYGSDCVPPGRRPVIGGHEANGEPLYHSVAEWDGHFIPGKAAQHLVRNILAFMILPLLTNCSQWGAAIGYRDEEIRVSGQWQVLLVHLSTSAFVGNMLNPVIQMLEGLTPFR